MVRWVAGLTIVSLLTMNFLTAEELAEAAEKNEPATMEKQETAKLDKPEGQPEVKRRWVKKGKSVPRARKALPGRKKALTATGEVVFLDEEEEDLMDDEDLPTSEGHSS